MSTASLSPSLAHSAWRGLRPAVPALVLGLLAWTFLFHAEIEAAVQTWIDSTAYNHGFVVLPLAGWLAWDRRRAAAGLAPAPTPWPALAVLPLGLAWFAADRLGIMEGRQLAALGMLEALLVAWLGWRLARAMAAPLAYLVFLVPFGAFITPALQSFTSQFVDAGLDVIGIPHVVTINLIEIPEGRFYVAEACAGLRFLVAAVAFGALYALLLYRSPWRRVMFVAASCVVPVIANGLRALGIVVLGHILGSAEAAATDHVVYGWGFFSAVILLMTVAGLPFRQDLVREARVAGPAARVNPWVAWPAVAAVLLLAAAGPAAATLLDRPRATPRLVLPEFAPTAACRPADRPQRFLCDGATLTASLRVLPPGIGPRALRDAEYAAIGGRPSEEDRTESLVVPGGVPSMWRLVVRQSPSRIVATATYLDGGPAVGGLRERLRVALDGLNRAGGPAVVVAVALETPDAMPPDRARALLRAFLAAQPLAAIARATMPSPAT